MRNQLFEQSELSTGKMYGCKKTRKSNLNFMNILLVEDNQKLSDNIKTVLTGNNYIVDQAFDAESALTKAIDNSYDLIILDLALPDGDGIDICKKIRNNAITTAILMLTARINLESKVEGLDEGADDYLTKPFLMEELLARIRALTRRNSVNKQSEIVVQNLSINLTTKTVKKKNEEIQLSPIEMRILELLILKRGKTLSAMEMYESVWGSHDEDITFSDALKVHMSRLRKKIGEEIIKTIPGFGYIIE